jgi:predicted chitinase
MARNRWILTPRWGPPICIVRWMDLMSGEAFQESCSPAAVEGLMDALAVSELTANMIFVDIAMHECRVPQHSNPLSAEERDVIREAFRKRQYVVVSLHPPGEISYEQLHGIMPRLPPEKALEYLPFLIAAMTEYRITTPLRQAAFLAQVAEESAELRQFTEFSSGAEYEGRHDLGSTQPGDGSKFKGRGPIQLTGRAAYARAGRALDLDLVNHPEMVATPEIGFRTTGWFWENKVSSQYLNHLADGRKFDAITHAVNGGYNGKAARDAYYQVAKQVLRVIDP